MKKRNRTTYLQFKPGIGRQYLLDNYCSTPADGHLLIGHVLHLYHESGSLVAKTIRTLYATLPFRCTISRSYMQSIIRSYSSFRNLSRRKEMKKFLQFCNGKFASPSLTGQAAAAPVLMDTDSEEISNVSGPCVALEKNPSKCNSGDTEDSNSIPQTPPPEHQEVPLPTRKSKRNSKVKPINAQHSGQNSYNLNQAQDMISEQSIEMICEKSYLDHSVTRLQSALKVRDVTIAMLKKKLKEAESVKIEGQLMQLRQTHKCSKESSKFEQDSIDNTYLRNEIIHLKDQLKKKDKTISSLEMTQFALEENIRKLKEQLQDEREKHTNEAMNIHSIKSCTFGSQPEILWEK